MNNILRVCVLGVGVLITLGAAGTCMYFFGENALHWTPVDFAMVSMFLNIAGLVGITLILLAINEKLNN